MPDPFTTLGLEPRFDLDEADLHQRFLRESAAHHPDRFVDPLEQADAADRSAAINHAYRTLSDPESRAKALLAVLGESIDDTAKPELPPALLMEVMEVREEMEAAVASDDSSTLARLRGRAEQQRKDHLAAIADRFAQSPPDTAGVQHELNALRYVQRMLDQMPG